MNLFPCHFCRSPKGQSHQKKSRNPPYVHKADGRLQANTLASWEHASISQPAAV